MESGNLGSDHEFGTFRTSNKWKMDFGSEHEFGRFSIRNAWKVEILDLSTNLEHLGSVMHGNE